MKFLRGQRAAITSCHNTNTRHYTCKKHKSEERKGEIDFRRGVPALISFLILANNKTLFIALASVKRIERTLRGLIIIPTTIHLSRIQRDALIQGRLHRHIFAHTILPPSDHIR